MNQELTDLPPKERIKTILCTLDRAAQLSEMGQGPLNPATVRKVVAELQNAIRQTEVRS